MGILSMCYLKQLPFLVGRRHIWQDLPQQQLATWIDCRLLELVLSLSFVGHEPEPSGGLPLP